MMLTLVDCSCGVFVGDREGGRVFSAAQASAPASGRKGWGGVFGGQGRQGLVGVRTL